MPTKGDWKKPFAAGLKMVQDSKTCALRLCAEQIFQLARTDGIIKDPKATVQITSKKGKKILIYKPSSPLFDRIAKRNRLRKKEEKVFSNTKFVDRTGNLDKAFNMSNFRIENKNGEPCGIFSFTGEAEKALRHGDSKLSRNKVDITDSNGNVIATQPEKGRRRPIELAARKVCRFFAKVLKKELDSRVRNIK
jgi:hypothetical protein